MIELLVAVLVMGIGVLGVTALQMVSLQNNRTALVRAEAVQLAYDMMDRIRANPGIGAVPGSDYSGLSVDDDPPAAPNCIDASCSAAQMVTFDQAVWKCQLGNFHENDVCIGLRDDGLIPSEDQQPGLPEGDGSVVVDGGGLVTVTVQWTEGGNQQQTVVIESRV